MVKEKWLYFYMTPNRILIIGKQKSNIFRTIHSKYAKTAALGGETNVLMPYCSRLQEGFYF